MKFHPYSTLIFFFFMLLKATTGYTEKASIIIDLENNKIVHANQEDVQHPPASLTKMMSLYLAFEDLKNKKITLETILHVPLEAEKVEPSKLNLKKGDKIKIKDILPALAVKSANDAAITLAQGLAGTEAQFVKRMNAKAQELGLKNTHFSNPSGLPHEEQVTTARDILTLALALKNDFPEYFPLFSTKEFTYQGTTYKNTNRLLHQDVYINGIKTGYIRDSKYNLVISFQKNEHHYICVLLGAETINHRDYRVTNLLLKLLPTPMILGFKKLKEKLLPFNRSVSPKRTDLWCVHIAAFQKEAKLLQFIKNQKKNLRPYLIKPHSYRLLQISKDSKYTLQVCGMDTWQKAQTINRSIKKSFFKSFIVPFTPQQNP